jgi:hypothetical protein
MVYHSVVKTQMQNVINLNKNMKREAQIIKYKCCGKVFAVCMVPECYTEKDWLKNLRKYALRGDTIEVVEAGDFSFGKCECVEPKEETPDLFNSI